MAEHWKEIEGESGYYVSTLGRVKSTNYRRTGKEKIMKQSDAGGRTVVCIRGRMYIVRRLVAQAFVPNPKGYTDVHSKNGDSLDCRAENLEWVYHNYCKKTAEM